LKNNQDDQERFEKIFMSAMNSAFVSLYNAKLLKELMELTTLKIQRSQATLNPFQELTYITGPNELTPDALLHIYMSVKVDRDEHSFFGNFRVNEKGYLIPMSYDEEKVDVSLEQIKKDRTLTEQAIEAVKRNKEKIWDVLITVLNVVLMAIRGST